MLDHLFIAEFGIQILKHNNKTSGALSYFI